MSHWKRKQTLVLGLLLAAAMATAACGSETGHGGKDHGSFIDSRPAQIDVDPHTLAFQQVAIGAQSTRQIDISNLGTSKLRIFSMSLKEFGPRDGNQYDERQEFKEADGWSDNTVTVAPHGHTSISVTYLPQNQTHDEGVITLETNDPANPTVKIPVATQRLAPEISARSPVTFQGVPGRDQQAADWPGDFVIENVQNTGSAPLEISNVYVSDTSNDIFSISFPPDAQSPPSQDGDTWPTTLAPNESFPVRVWFRPIDNLPQTNELVFESNDPSQPQYVVDLQGNSGAPCIAVSPSDSVDFGQGSLGQVSQKTVTVENCSRSEQLEVSDIAISDDGDGVFAIQNASLPTGLPDSPATIDPGEQATFVVTFEPTAEQQYDGQLTIESNDPGTRQLQIPIVGSGSSNQCPTAVATAHLQGSTRPQTTLQTTPLSTVMFDGSGSSDPDGSIQRYEWTVLSRPQGSTQLLLPNSQSPNPRLFLDLAGTYEIELKVYDDQGAASCGGPAIITISVIPDDDVHVQLVWDTPSDPDQTDADGTDLDLHYMHPNATAWNTAPWDIYWRNPRADWGVQGDSSDDPSLDIDDTDGAGPENVNQSNLENLQYQVGVYYYADNGKGASYATVRIYIRGQLARQFENKYMAGTGSFWKVAAIQWPSGNIIPVDRMSQGFPTSP